MGPNCDVEYRPEGGTKRFLAAFNDIHEISYEEELLTRGRVILELKQNSQVWLWRESHQISCMGNTCHVYHNSSCLVCTLHSCMLHDLPAQATPFAKVISPPPEHGPMRLPIA